MGYIKIHSVNGWDIVAKVHINNFSKMRAAPIIFTYLSNSTWAIKS